MGAEPVGEAGDVEGLVGDGDHGGDGVIGSGWAPGLAVANEEQDHRDERGVLVAVGQRVVVGQVPAQHSGLVDEVVVGVIAGEPGSGAWSAESARARFAMRLMVAGSIWRISAARWTQSSMLR